MAAISPAGHDRLVILGFGFATCALMEVMRRMLVHYRDAAQVPPYQSKPQYITQDVEDSLKVSTLGKLLDSSNYCIQETTSIIVCERALHDQNAINALLWYITRPEHESREKGIRALTMLINSSTVGMINKPEAWAALVKSLEYSITDYPHNTFDPEWDNWHLRDAAEKDCLMVLAQLVDKFGAEGLVKSRFVERWLAKEPWADAGVDRMIMFADSLHSNHRLSELVVPLFRDQAGRQQLVKAKLVPAELLKDIASREVRMINGEGTAGEDFEGMFVDNRRRRDQNSEEDHIRRRHREAMVLNDGTRPLERGDIIQRER
ncbi:hypothetical protein QTJ16_002975 [Diplocarpon rosae]|uniref:Cytoskeleton-associated protein n=1 Tax=Diplocarpon rosae TaxID=946125 RepID=A0AAD9T4A9_9HELO|nr:hypothetical protein QTJ16_002975 [Diplocarpon rosae]PBP22850.1 cytoskeleton-associated protein [Diplocarpon rosae]